MRLLRSNLGRRRTLTAAEHCFQLSALTSDKISQNFSCICGNFPYINLCELTSARFLEIESTRMLASDPAPLAAAESESFEEEAIAIGNS
jgi:hypothetical protein